MRLLLLISPNTYESSHVPVIKFNRVSIIVDCEYLINRSVTTLTKYK